MSGLVILVSGAQKDALNLQGIDKDKLRIFVVDSEQGKDAAMQQVEKWMSSQGLG